MATIVTILKFFGLCDHKWAIIEKCPLEHSDGKNISGFLFVIQCEKCGNIVKRKIAA